MDFSTLMQSEPQEVIMCVIYKEHTLGYLFKSNSQSKYLTIGVLHSSVIKGATTSIYPDNIFIDYYDMQNIRKATLKDFNDFRVSSKGHI